MSRIVRIACTGAAKLDLDALEPLQGDLKLLTEADAAKLERAIAIHGFCFPICIWRDRAGRERIIDGHQRRHVLRKMRDEGWEVPPLPVVYIDADDEQHAKYLVLAAISQFGRVDMDELANFAGNADISLKTLFEDFRLPDVALPDLDGALAALAETDTPKDDEAPIKADVFLVTAEFDNAHDQSMLAEELEAKGIKCRLASQ